MNELDIFRHRISRVLDPSDPYTQEDFDKEFSTNVNTALHYKTEFKFVNKSNNPDPSYATDGASGFDIRASLDEQIIVQSGDRVIVPTGLFFEIPENFEIQVRARSGLAAKNGIGIVNGIGTIDSDYRGEIKVILINLGDNAFVINNGDRIAQCVIVPVFPRKMLKLSRVDEISDTTERSTNGFGSTGVK